MIKKAELHKTRERDALQQAFHKGKVQGAEIAVSKAAEEKASWQKSIAELEQQLDTKTKVLTDFL